MQTHPGEYGHKPGEQHRDAKLSSEDVKEIIRLFNSGGYTKALLGRMYGVDRTTISKIFCGDNWKCLIKEKDIQVNNSQEFKRHLPTPRQKTVMDWWLQGCSRKEIAAKMNIHWNDVQSHLIRLVGKNLIPEFRERKLKGD